MAWISCMTHMLVCHCLYIEKTSTTRCVGKKATFCRKSNIFEENHSSMFFFGQTPSPEYSATVHHVWKQSLKDFFEKSLRQSFFSFRQKWHFFAQNEDISPNFFSAQNCPHIPTFWCAKFGMSINFGPHQVFSIFIKNGIFSPKMKIFRKIFFQLKSVPIYLPFGVHSVAWV